MQHIDWVGALVKRPPAVSFLSCCFTGGYQLRSTLHPIYSRRKVEHSHYLGTPATLGTHSPQPKTDLRPTQQPLRQLSIGHFETLQPKTILLYKRSTVYYAFIHLSHYSAVLTARSLNCYGDRLRRQQTEVHIPTERHLALPKPSSQAFRLLGTILHLIFDILGLELCPPMRIRSLSATALAAAAVFQGAFAQAPDDTTQAADVVQTAAMTASASTSTVSTVTLTRTVMRVVDTITATRDVTFPGTSVPSASLTLVPYSNGTASVLGTGATPTTTRLAQPSGAAGRACMDTVGWAAMVGLVGLVAM